MKRVSKKRSMELAKYAVLLAKLCLMNGTTSELSGKPAQDCHHIDGRNGKRVYDPFNVILVTREEHDWETAHHSFERIQELKAIVKEIRIKQGFVESDYE